MWNGWILIYSKKRTINEDRYELAIGPDFTQYPRAIYRFGLPFRYPPDSRAFVQVTHYDQVVRYRARFARGIFMETKYGYRNC